MDDAAIFAAMSKLVPEKRMDKNGKITTRWVSPDSGGTAQILPAPALADTASDRTDREVLMSVLTFLKSDVYTTTTMHFNTEYLINNAPEEMRALDNELREGTAQLRECWKQHLERINLRAGDDEDSYLPAFHKTKMIVRAQAAIAEQEVGRQDYVGYRSAALRSFVDEGRKDIDYLIPASLMAVWIRSGEDTDLTKELYSLEYICEMYEEVMEHRYAIKERGSIDPLVIEAIIESEARSLSSGVL